MKRLIILALLVLSSVSAYALEYVNAAVRLDMERGIILGVMENGGEQKVFEFDLKDADFNDGTTIAIYKNWLPEIPEGFGLRLNISYPDGYLVVAESNRARTTEKGMEFEFDYPSGRAAIAISPLWQKKTISYKGIEISTYFTEKNSGYSEMYFDRLKELFDLYLPKFGDYPYSSFSVVDVPYPVGHALTGMTFISGSIIGMPFLTEVSLGHELVHQWAGVGVDVDGDDGNWAEALTTYLADRMYAEIKGEGAEYRKNALLSYMSHARQGEDGTCLMDFRYNKDKSAQAVGYSKGMMVFAMLETMLGREDFDRSIRTFFQTNMNKAADWDDIKDVMETVSGIELDDFFDGWLTETSVADFAVRNVKSVKKLYGYSVSFELANKTDGLEYPLEVLVKTEEGDVYDYLYIKGESKEVTIKTDSEPLEIVIDPAYKTARVVRGAESRPTLNQLYSKYEKTFFVNPELRYVYEPVVSTLENVEIVSDDADPYRYTGTIMIFAGAENRAYRKIFRKDIQPEGVFSVKGIFGPRMDIMAYELHSRGAAVSKINARRISHYGKYSGLVSDGGRSYKKLTDESDAGMRISLKKETRGVAVSKPLSVEEIVAANAGSRIFLVGEQHDQYAHHVTQLEVIKALAASGKDLAIGLEMVQKPFQKYLDQYVGGEITEQEMLAKTEYFDRWRFDFRLYRMIFEYAAANDIPLVALNLERELTKKVAGSGINSLTEEERANIPEDIEYTTGPYRDDLYQIFSMHAMGREFDNFYEAQLLWDETMADSAYKFMKENPEKTMVVIAGNGHVRFGYGIADRLKRRTGQDYVSIVQDEDSRAGIADYILYPPEMEYEESPKIGVMVDDTDEGLVVKEVSEDKPGEKAGVLKDDIITGLNGSRVEKLTDLKITLAYTESGVEYDMTVRRDGEEKELKITF